LPKHICCNLCPQTFPVDIEDLELRKKRHEEFHNPSSTDYKRNLKLGNVELYYNEL